MISKAPAKLEPKYAQGDRRWLAEKALASSASHTLESHGRETLTEEMLGSGRSWSCLSGSILIGN